MAEEIVRGSDESDSELLPLNSSHKPPLEPNMGKSVFCAFLGASVLTVEFADFMSSRPSHSLTKPSRSILKRGQTSCAPEMEGLGSKTPPHQGKRPKTMTPEDEIQSLSKTYRSPQRSITFATPEQNHVIEPLPLHSQDQNCDSISMMPQSYEPLAPEPTASLPSSSAQQQEHELQQQPTPYSGAGAGAPECCSRSSKRPQSIQWDHSSVDTDPMSSASFARARRVLTDLPHDGVSQPPLATPSESLNVDLHLHPSPATTSARGEENPLEASDPSVGSGEHDVSLSSLQFDNSVSNFDVTPPDLTPTAGQQQQHNGADCAEAEDSRRSSGSNVSLLPDARAEFSKNGTMQATEETPSVHVSTHPSGTTTPAISEHDTHKSEILAQPHSAVDTGSLCERIGYSPISDHGEDSGPLTNIENPLPEEPEKQVFNCSQNDVSNIHIGHKPDILPGSHEGKKSNAETEAERAEEQNDEDLSVRPQDHVEAERTEASVNSNHARERGAVLQSAEPNHREEHPPYETPITPPLLEQSSTSNDPVENSETLAIANTASFQKLELPAKSRQSHKRKVKRGKTSSAALLRKRLVTDLDDDVIWLNERPVAETPVHQDTEMMVKTEKGQSSRPVDATGEIEPNDGLGKTESAQDIAPSASETTQAVALDTPESAPKTRSRRRTKTGESENKKPEPKKRRKSTSISTIHDVVQDSIENGVSTVSPEQRNETSHQTDKENRPLSPPPSETQNLDSPFTPEPQNQCPSPKIQPSDIPHINHTPTKPPNPFTPPPPSTPPVAKGPDKHSPIAVDKKVTHRVGLSRSAKIAPLLRTIRK